MQKLANGSLVWDIIRAHLPAAARSSITDFLNVNCPMCVSRGAGRPDTRARCGVKHSSQGVGVHCFNCGFKALAEPGGLLSKGMQRFLAGIGIDERSIKILNHRLAQFRNIVAASSPTGMATSLFRAEFNEAALPSGARSFLQCAEDGVNDPRFEAAVAYVATRGDDLWRPELYHWTPSTDHHLDQRVIVPFWWQEKIVGYAARTFDPAIKPKYFISTPSDFLFNAEVMLKRERKYIILVEGIFDALAIDGVATQGARLNARQQQWINGYNKTVIVVPDRDDAGQRLIDVALSNDWYVAFPRQASKYQVWDSDIKDTADAVQRYGRLFTLRGLLESATNNKNHINLLRKILTN